MTYPFLRSDVGTFLPICEHRSRLAAIGAGEGPMAASTTPSVDEVTSGVDAGSPTGLTPGSHPACPCGPGRVPVT